MELALAFIYEMRGSRDLRTEHLSQVNRALGSAIDLLDHVPPEAFGGKDTYFRAKQAIAEAERLVVAAETRGTRPAE